MNLIERLRTVKWEVADNDDPTHKCVLVDMCPDDFRALLSEAATALEAARAEVERLNRCLGRIVEGDGDSTLTIRMGTDAFAAAREYLLRDRGESHTL